MAVFRRARLRPDAVSIGRRIFRFKTHGSRRHFSIHEDLVCSRSQFFKQRLQENRKAIEGECSICHEVLNTREDDVTFCRRTCGQNFHEHCIEQWTRTHTICPMCRNIWHQAAEEPDALDGALDADALQLYLDWLYTDRLQLPMHVDRRGEEYSMFMFKAWVISDVVQDAQFRHALAANILAAPTVQYTNKVMHYIFVETSSPTMKAFVLDLMRASHNPNQLIERIPTYPTGLTQALFDTLLKSSGEPLTVRDLVNKHTSESYVFVEPPRRMPPNGRGPTAAGNNS